MCSSPFTVKTASVCALFRCGGNCGLFPIDFHPIAHLSFFMSLFVISLTPVVSAIYWPPPGAFCQTSERAVCSCQLLPTFSNISESQTAQAYLPSHFKSPSRYCGTYISATQTVVRGPVPGCGPQFE